VDVGAIDGLARAIKVRGGAALPFFLTPFSFMIMENLYKDRERSYRMTSRPSRTEPCVQAYNGGVVLVSHDFRLIDQVCETPPTQVAADKPKRTKTAQPVPGA
jgi:hypothetical protein